MTMYESSLNFNKPPAEVFAYLINFENQKKLNQYIVSMEVPKHIEVGSKYKMVTANGPVKFEITNEITDLQPGRLLRVKTHAAPPVEEMITTQILEAVGSGTKVTMQLEMPPSAHGKEDSMKQQMLDLINDSLTMYKNDMGA
ncbi:MAG: SRPBCC family protein [Anaerolineales bacterium]|jgi:uncharacterized membrane protein|nr:SRPBCC family protein [Anaerolineales bacterium]